MRGVELADHSAFFLPPAEASAMDPQQRLLLECGYATLHSARLARQALAGSVTGVFLGFGGSDFGQLLAATPAGSSVYASTGSTSSIASGRLSYVLGLHGPCASFDTACSSALTAYHTGLHASQLAECAAAVAAGVNLILLPGAGTLWAIAGMTSSLGRSFTFDVRADGFGRGEACGAVALHPSSRVPYELIDALGSAVRQDGRSASLTAPSGQAQQGLLGAALADASTLAAALALSEAHGTGTALGDPIEAGSLAAAVLSEREAPLAVGGVKANIGHAEPAAGTTGLLTLALGLRAFEAAPNAQLRALNPHLGGALRGAACALPSRWLFSGHAPELAACRRLGTAARSRTRCCGTP